MVQELKSYISDVILAATFGLDSLWLYCGITIVLVLVPNIIVQIFSARWNKIDETLTGPVALLHGCLLGTLHRYPVSSIYSLTAFLLTDKNCFFACW